MQMDSSEKTQPTNTISPMEKITSQKQHHKKIGHRFLFLSLNWLGPNGMSLTSRMLALRHIDRGTMAQR